MNAVELNTIVILQRVTKDAVECLFRLTQENNCIIFVTLLHIMSLLCPYVKSAWGGGVWHITAHAHNVTQPAMFTCVSACCIYADSIAACVSIDGQVKKQKKTKRYDIVLTDSLSSLWPCVSTGAGLPDIHWLSSLCPLEVLPYPSAKETKVSTEQLL